MQSISTLLRKIKKKPRNGEALLELRRCVHTLKGATAVVGLKSTSELAHRMEDLLDQLHDGGIKLSDEILNLIVRDGRRSRGFDDRARPGKGWQSTPDTVPGV